MDNIVEIQENYARIRRLYRSPPVEPKRKPMQGPPLPMRFKSRAEKAISAACLLYEVEPADILGPSRKRMLVMARRYVAARLRGQGLSYPVIGKAIQRDHGSIYSLLNVGYRRRKNARDRDRLARMK